MNYPHLTPRRWFWTLMAAGLLWSFTGTRWSVAGMQSFQSSAIESPTKLLLTPASFTFGVIQTTARNAIRGTVVHDGSDSQSADALRAKIRELENSLAQEHAINQEYASLRAALDQIDRAGIPIDSVRFANVTGHQSGAGTCTIDLDKGASAGITKGAPVLFASVSSDQKLQGVTLLGRVESVQQLGCVARLLSDPGSKVLAQIIRPQTSATANNKIMAEPHVVYGLGSNNMEIRDLNLQPNNPPQRGDLVQLIDNDFPAHAQYMVIGQIDTVGTSPTNALRYSLHITPRVPITSLSSVMILVK